MNRLNLIAATLILAQPAALAAAPLTVQVKDAAGRPVENAVVTFRPAGALARRAKPARRFEVSQKQLQFHPFVLVVPAGAEVAFPNLDPTKHHVYSFSPAKRFELKLFARDQSRSVRFDQPGVVALGCNIHDAMTAFIVVADSAWTARTNAHGMVQFPDAPAASGTLSVWHPYLRAPGNSIARPIASGGGTQGFTVRLRAPPMHMSAY